MIGTHVTGSKYHRARACPASVALPQVDDLEPSPPAERGTAIHRFLQDVSDGRTRAGLTVDAARGLALKTAASSAKVTPEIFEYLEVLDVEELPTGLGAEIALAYDWKAGKARILAPGGARDYSDVDAESEIPMTLDVTGVGPARVLVADYKSGRADLPPAATNGQLWIGGLAAARAYDRNEAELQLIRLDEDGRPRLSKHVADEWDLDTFADEVRVTMEHVAGARLAIERGQTPNVSTGAHCRYCPAFRACPAQTAMVRAAMGGPLMRTGGPFPPGALAPERVAATWRQVREVRTALAALESEIVLLAARQPIDLGDGKVLGPVETAKEMVKADESHAALEARYGREAADSAMERKTSKAAIRRVVQRYKPEKAKISTSKGDGELDRLLDQIRATGGVRVSRSVRVRETTPDKIATHALLPVSAAEATAEEAPDGDEW